MISNQTNKITVVTATFNSGKTLQRTIDSVRNQNYKELEYFVIDGGSSDNTIEILKQNSDIITNWISERDQGIYDAFNKGIKLASGDWIAFLNSDDWYEPEVLNKLNALINTNTDCEIITGRTKFWQDGHPDYIFDSDPSKLDFDTTIGHQSTLTKMSVHNRIGKYDLKYKLASDYAFFLKAKVSGVKFYTTDLVISNMSSAGASDVNWPTVYNEVMRAQQEILHQGTKPYLRYLYKLIRTGCSRRLQKLGLGVVVAQYRKHFSILKKEKL